MSAFIFDLSTKRFSDSSEFTNLLRELTVLNDQKLWFQLSEKLEYLYFDEEVSKVLDNNTKISIFEEFIKPIIKNLNDLKVVDFLIYTLQNDISGLKPESKIETLQKVKQILIELDQKKVNQNDGYMKRINSITTINCEIIKYLLLGNDLNGSVDLLKEVSETLSNPLDENFIAIRTKLAYYQALLKLNEYNREFNDYYYNSLLFISCYQKLNEDDYFINEAYLNKVFVWNNFRLNLLLATLLADKIYHFNEVLDSTWLNTTNFVNNSEEDNKSEKILKEIVSQSLMESQSSSYESHITQLQVYYPALLDESRLNFLKQKKALVNLVNLIFNENINKKILRFDEISSNISVSTEDVELLLMKAMSLNLMKGKIDQINQQIKINWIQPRVMTKKEIEVLQKNLINWRTNYLEMEILKLSD
ncbi:hypothetical protein QEN19_001652 [Hanseniaspora menglaensis]